MTLRFATLFCAFALYAGAQTSTQSPAQTPAPASQQKLPTVRQTVEVTATKLPEEPIEVPAAIAVMTGEELRGRGVRDLRDALLLSTGVEIAPGGDAGPASSVPDFWGLKEFDAFLLVVDGVPWGGAFNPALTALDLSDVERIEVLRGPAPVTYGATSFVGVIQVVHTNPASAERSLELTGGSFGSGGGTLSFPIPLSNGWKSRLVVGGEREGFNDDRTSYSRYRGAWRVERKMPESQRLWFMANLNWLGQDPASPRPRDGAVFSPLVPLDANLNPAGAYLNDRRGGIMGGFDRPAAGGEWSATVSVSHSRQSAFRGFLVNIEDAPDNAHGVRERIRLTDVYLDSHLSKKLYNNVRFLFGADYIHGSAIAKGADFDYSTTLNGTPPPLVIAPDSLDVQIHDHRNFVGPYTALEWTPQERFRVDAGVRLNITHETQNQLDAGAGTQSSDHRTDFRTGANLGAIFTAWQQDQNSVRLFANYRDTFKPGAIDFGIGEGEAEILKPETARSVEGGLKGRFWQHRLEAEASAFLMDFTNLVTAVTINGDPALINAGKQRFKGFESELAMFLSQGVVAHATYSFHDAKFTDFVQDFDGVPTQLAGKRLEMSARHLAAAGINYVPAKGFMGGFEVSYTGSRFLNKRNTAPAGGFTTLGLSAGYHTSRWELRADARNLTDRRDPVSESELGDAQYYLLPSRKVNVTLRMKF